MATEPRFRGASRAVAHGQGGGLNTIYGRSIHVANESYSLVNSEEQRSACESMAHSVKPLLVNGVAMGGPLSQCLDQQYKLTTIDGEKSGDASYLSREYPLAWQLMATPNTVWGNEPYFLPSKGALRGQVLCMDSPDDTATAGEQEDLNSFRQSLRTLGFSLKVDITYGTTPNDGLAVTKFGSSGCTVAFVVGLLTEPSGFQNVAQQQGYSLGFPPPAGHGLCSQQPQLVEP